MKKTILILTSLILITSCGCKKSEEKPVEPAPVTTKIDSAFYEVKITSNFTQTQTSFDNITDNQTQVFVTAPTTFSFLARSDKHYMIRTYSTKNSSDSTLFMTDSKHIWNRLYIRDIKANQVVYDHIDSVGSPGWCIVSNQINIKK